MFLLVLFVIILCLFSLCVTATICRSGHPELEKLKGWAYAHRGLHGEGIPENSLRAFQKAADSGYGAELDVHLLSDGNLAVFHDSSLRRMTGRSGDIESLTLTQLQECFLGDTMETIPEFSQVMEIFRGKAPVIVELKSKGDNVDDLCKAVCKYLDEYDSPFCVESFDPRCVSWFRKHRPQVIRGQLAQNYFRARGSKLSFPIKLIMSNHLMNFITYPDFIAYRYADRRNFFTFLCRKLWSVPGVTWTVRTMHEYRNAIREDWIPIFERIKP